MAFTFHGLRAVFDRENFFFCFLKDDARLRICKERLFLLHHALHLSGPIPIAMTGLRTGHRVRFPANSHFIHHRYFPEVCGFHPEMGSRVKRVERP